MFINLKRVRCEIFFVKMYALVEISVRNDARREVASPKEATRGQIDKVGL